MQQGNSHTQLINLFQSRVIQGETEKINSKKTSYFNPEIKNSSKDQVENISKESEATYIEELVSKNNELKSLSLKVSCFFVNND